MAEFSVSIKCFLYWRGVMPVIALKNLVKLAGFEK